MRQTHGLWKLLLPLGVLLLLIAAFYLDGGAGRQVPDASASSSAVSSPAEPAAAEPAETDPEPDLTELPEIPEEPDTPELPEEVPETPEDPAPATPAASQAAAASAVLPGDSPDGTYTCTISVSCAALLDNMDLCDPEKTELVPSDGWLLPPTEVTFYEGESVFNVLQRTCKQRKLHMEYENTPLYGSAYIEGIGNLYEFDAGELSGWMYAVNGWYPNYGCSQYILEDGDEICWRYTCDLGADIGGAAADQRSA